MGVPGNNGAPLTVSPLRQCQSRAMLQGIWQVAFPPEISASETVVTGPKPFPLEHENQVNSSLS